MKSHATARFWRCYNQLPPPVQQQARQTYQRWCADQSHPSLHFKKLHGSSHRFSVRVGLHHRALGHLVADRVEWVWIGSHAEYDQLLRR